MSALTIGGVDLDCSDAGEGDKIAIGEETRAYAGNLRGTIRDEKATFNFVTLPASSTTWASLSSVIALGAHVTCSGSGIPSGAIVASVKATEKAIPGTSPVLYIITGSGQEV
jgi:hypothetical protein